MASKSIKAGIKRRRSTPRTSKGRLSGGRPLTREKYMEIFREYSRGVSAPVIATKCDVCATTVRKYIADGDPDRGMEPMRERLQKVRTKALAMADHSATQFRSRIYGQAQNVMGEQIANVQDWMDLLNLYKNKHVTRDEKGRIVKVSEGKGKKGFNVRKAAELTSALAQATSSTQAWQKIFNEFVGWGETDEDGEFRGWTVEELEEFAKDRTIPDRFLADTEEA